MKATVLQDDRPRWPYLLLGLLFSFGLHILFAFSISKLPVPEYRKPVWVEMTIAEPPPPQPVVETPPAEPEPMPKTVVKPVDPPVDKLPEPAETPPESDTPPPPEAKATPRKIQQGLSNNSFLPGTGGINANAGNTTAAPASKNPVDPSELGEFVTLPYSRVTKPPKLKIRPPLQVPDEVVAAEVVGRVEVELTLSSDGTVTTVEIIDKLHPAADAACVANAKKTRWEPYFSNGKPTAVTGVPYSCKFEKIED